MNMHIDVRKQLKTQWNILKLIIVVNGIYENLRFCSTTVSR